MLYNLRWSRNMDIANYISRKYWYKKKFTNKKKLMKKTKLRGNQKLIASSHSYTFEYKAQTKMK